MIIINEKLATNNILSKEKYSNKINYFNNNVIKRIRKIDDCIIIINNIKGKKYINWDKIIELYGDLTGYEASCNEILIDTNNIENTELALILVEELSEFLKAKFPKYHFKIVSQIDTEIIMRFYTVRVGEEWIDIENIDSYREKLLVKII